MHGDSLTSIACSGQRSRRRNANVSPFVSAKTMTLALLIALAGSLVAMGLIVRRLEQG